MKKNVPVVVDVEPRDCKTNAKLFLLNYRCWHEVLVQFFFSIYLCIKILSIVYYGISITFGSKKIFVLLDKLLACKF